MRALLLISTLLLATGCGSQAKQAQGTLVVTALAGPTCPVVQAGQEEECADRPVEGASIEVGGHTETTAAGGVARFTLAPGEYEVRPQPVEGLVGGAPDATATVTADHTTHVTVTYDTGIR